MTLLGALFGWSITGYLLWRAWPAVKHDLSRLPRPRRYRGRYAAGRGDRDGAL